MKTCPVCRSMAFDDAEVCYGCLDRYQEEGGPCDSARPATGQASVAAPQRQQAAVAAGRLGEGARLEAPPVAKAMQDEARVMDVAVRPNAPADRAGANGEERKAVQGAPLDGTGWVVRFEIPGFVPVSFESDPSGDGAGSRPSPHPDRCALLRDDAASAVNQPGGVIVRFQPQLVSAAEDGRPRRLARGSHARAAMIDARSLALEPERA